MNTEAPKSQDTDTDDPLLKALARLEKAEGGGVGEPASAATAATPVAERSPVSDGPQMTPAQQKLAAQAEALARGAQPGQQAEVASNSHVSPAQMNAAALRQAAGSAAQQLLNRPPSETPQAKPAAAEVPPIQKPSSPRSTPEPKSAAMAPAPPSTPAPTPPESKSALPVQRAPGEPPARLDDAPSATPPTSRPEEPIAKEEPKPAPAQASPAPVSTPERREAPEAKPPAQAPVQESEQPKSQVRESPQPRMDDVPREVAPSDAMPLVDDGPAPARKRVRNRKQTGTLKVVAVVLCLQALLVVIGLVIVYFSPTARGAFRKAMHRLLGTSAVVAAAEPTWIPEDFENDGTLGSTFAASGDQLSFLKQSVEDLQRQLSVTPKEAWKELRVLSQRNQLTAFADEAITLGSRKSYTDLKQIAATSTEPAQRHGAEAELLRVKFFYASGTRLGAYKLPVASLYPTLKNSEEEDLTPDQLIKLLLDQKKDWRVRSRVALLLGESRSYEVAEALVEAVRTDESLDVIKECIFSFEENTGYRSPGLLEIEDLLKWWEANSARLKARSG